MTLYDSYTNTATYPFILQKAFMEHYADRSDVWSHDVSLQFAAEIAAETLRFDNSLKKQCDGAHLRVLDLGCGKGNHAGLFKSNIYVGIDLIAQPEWTQISAHSSALFLQGDFLDQQWNLQKLGRFELVLDNGCFHHQHPSSLLKYLSKVKSLLNRGGYFSLTVWADKFLEGKVDSKGRYHNFFTLHALKSMLKKCGFSIIKHRYHMGVAGVTQLQVMAVHAAGHKCK